MLPTAIILLGPPGSGKGTQAARLSAELSIPAISTGEILRNEAATGSVLGRLVQNVLTSGRLVNDEIMNQLVTKRLRGPDCQNGFILDGYPRTVSQAKQLDHLLQKLAYPDPVIFDFQISFEEVLSRLTKRLECPVCHQTFALSSEAGPRRCDRDGAGLVRRADDQAAVVAERLRLYAKNAAELNRYYKGRNYYSIAAARPIAAISQELVGIISSFRQQAAPPPSRPPMPARLRVAF